MNETVAPRRPSKAIRRRASEPTTEFPLSLHIALRAHDFFAKLDDDTLESIIFGLHIHRCAPGDVLIQEGTAGKSLFFVISGTVSVVSQRSETTIAELYKGAFFGEIAALYEVPRTATVISKTISSIAMLSRDDLLNAIGDRPEILEMIVMAARDRYLRGKSRPIPLGHRDDVHFQITALRSAFPFCKDLDDAYLLDLILLGQIRREHNYAIVSFAEDNSVVMVINGTIAYKDVVRGDETLFGSGEVAAIPDDASCVAYLAARKSTLYLKLPKEIFSRLVSRSVLPKIETTLERMSISPFVNSVEGNLDGATRLRRNSIANVLHHDQTIHAMQPVTPLPIPDSTEHIIGLPKDEDHIMFGSILQQRDIPISNLHMMLPSGDCSDIDFEPICTKVTDELVIKVTEVFGAKIGKLSLAKCLINDESIESVSKHARNLRYLKTDDCTRVGSFAFLQLLRSCNLLEILHISNCPGVDSSVLDALTSLNIVELDISYCRNVGDSLWTAITRLSQTLECLVMHRMVTLDEESVMQSLSPNAHQFFRLRILDLSDCAFLTTKALQYILNSSPNLQHLLLPFCTGIDETIPKAFVASDYESTIFMEYTKISPRKKLLSLDLSYCIRALNDQSIRSLCIILSNLQAISLKGAKHISKSAVRNLLNIKGLTRVNLSDCPNIDADTIQTAAQGGNWKILTSEKLIDL